ncbi:hypothetical protein DA096_00455 [Vibrio rotiferianus]|nr:hypothetical protein DA095_01695 [Vibrio rotiferianus]TMX61311.1 hypothetical protein DA093_00455 [Vibrio rotiferianus]TMX69526.1 hypothetical protein DA096_00455 [Vibrio rotiferianus]
MERIIRFFTFGLWGTKEERHLSRKINHSYTSLKVVGRGTVFISSKEVHQDLMTNNIYERARLLVEEK